MLKNGIAEQSSSSWASPCLLVLFCSDFRKVNSVTKPDSYPLPRMDDCIDQVGAATFISKLDLLKGYWPFVSKSTRDSCWVIFVFCHAYWIPPCSTAWLRGVSPFTWRSVSLLERQ